MRRPTGLYLAGIIVAVALFAWAMLDDRPDTLYAERPLTDATVIEQSMETLGGAVVLRVSHPTEELFCTIPRDAFEVDWPDVGTVLPVMYSGKVCTLPVWLSNSWRVPLVIAGALITVVLIGRYQMLPVWHRRRTAPARPKPQKQVAPVAYQRRPKRKKVRR